jgi:hypothetical protein
MPEFAVSAVERAVDGTLQVRLGMNNAAPAAPVLEIAAEEHATSEPAPDPSPRPSADPFARPEAPAQPAVDEQWHAEPVVSAPFADPAFPVEPAVDSGAFAESAPSADLAQAADWPAQVAVAMPEPTPLFPTTDSVEAPAVAEDDAGTEVARVIEKLASELRETAEHLAQLAAGLTPDSAPAHEHPHDSDGWEQKQSEPVDLAWNRDLPTADSGSPQYELPAVMTPEELDGISASESWVGRPATVEQPLPAGQPQEPPVDNADDEAKGWEAPRMPSVGAVPAMGGEQGSPEFKNEAHSAQAIALATAMGRRPSQVQLMASGFASFGIANSFIAAVRQIAGVRNVAIAELDQGRLKLTLDYFGSDSLEAQLQQLRDFPHQVVRASGKEIEIQLMAA